MSFCRVYQDVNSQEGVAILGARLVQVHEVYTHPPVLLTFLTITTLAIPPNPISGTLAGTSRSFSILICWNAG